MIESRPAAGILLAVIIGCHRDGVPRPPQDHPPPGAPLLLSTADVPLPHTTAGAIAVRNLEGEIDLFSRQLADMPGDGERRAALVSALLTRAQMLGRLDGYDRALALADEGVARHPRAGASYLTRARVRASLHLFGPALADVDMAARAGSADPSLPVVRAGVLAALGRGQEALVLYERARAGTPDIGAVAAEAALVSARGDAVRAATLFALARSAYRNVSPFPVAWLELQEGLHWERHDDLPRARASYEAACARLPAFALAAGRLARLEAADGLAGRRRAVARLTRVIATSDDPEYLGQLSALLAEDGRLVEAEPLRREAEARYTELLALHRAAFADHAARFWLGPGHDAERALALAEENVSLRPTSEARELYLHARAAVRSMPPGPDRMSEK